MKFLQILFYFLRLIVLFCNSKISIFSYYKKMIKRGLEQKLSIDRYILYIQIKHVEISNCQSFHHQSTTIFLKCISFRRGSSIGKKRKMCAFRNMFLCYVTITDMSLTVKNASSDVEFDISEYFIYIRW